jgi:hypothetical protein
VVGGVFFLVRSISEHKRHFEGLGDDFTEFLERLDGEGGAELADW